MAWENYNKGNTQKNDSVNTRGIQMKNKEGFEASTLVLQYWDDKLNVILHPQLKNPTEKQVYDYEQRIMATLRIDKAQSLIMGLDKVIDKAIEEDREASVGVTLGLSESTNMLVVSTMKREGELHVVLHVCREINPETKLPKQRFSYTFIKDDEVVEGYNVTTGEINDVMTMQTEYELFKEALEEYVEMMMQAQVHSDRYNDRFYRNSLMDKVTKIGAKVGALDSGHHTGSFNNSSAFANVNYGNNNGGANATSLDDLKDIFN